MKWKYAVVVVIFVLSSVAVLLSYVFTETSHIIFPSHGSDITIVSEELGAKRQTELAIPTELTRKNW